MIVFMKTVQIFMNALCILGLIALKDLIDLQVIFCITLLINSSMSVACIFYEKSRKNDKIMMVFNTMLIFMVAQIYTAITGIFASRDWFDYLYKAICFCMNAIMMGVTFDAYKRFNETHKD